MKTLVKLLLGLIVLVVVLVVGALVALPMVFDPNARKADIIAKVEAETGRKLALDGNIAMAWYPWLGVTIENVTLGNAPGFGETPFFKAQLLAARVKLLPLLSKDIRMDTVQVHGAELNLAVDAAGKGNWVDLVKPQDAARKEDFQPLRLGAFAVGGVDVKDARVTWVNAATGQSARVEKLNVATGALEMGRPVELSLAADFVSAEPALEGNVAIEGTVAYDESGEKFRVAPFTVSGGYRGATVPGGKAPISLTAALDVDLGAGTVSLADLQASALGMTASGQLNARAVNTDEPAVQAALEVQGSDLGEMFRILGRKALADAIGRGTDRAYSVKVNVDADRGTGVAKVTGLDARLAGATITGEFEATRFDTKTPHVKGTLDAKGPDLPTLLRIGGQLQPGTNSTLTLAGKALADTPDKAFDIEATFDADRESNTIKVPKLDAKLLGATITGRVDSPGAGKTNGELKATGADLPALLVVAGAFQGGKSALVANGRKLARMKDRAFEADARFSLDDNAGVIDVPALSLRGLGFTVAGSLAAKGLNAGNGSIDGKLAVKSDRPGPLLAALDQAGLGEVMKSLAGDARVTGSLANLAVAPLRVDATIAGKDIPGSPVKASLVADAKANLEKETLTISDLSVSGLGLNVKGRLDATGINSAPAYTGSLAVQPFNLRLLLAQLRQPIPVTADPSVLKRVALTTDLRGTADSISLSKLALTLDETSATGDLSVTNFEDPDIAFGLGVNAINADRYLAPRPEGKAGAPPSPEAAVASAMQLPVATLRKLKLKGNLTVGQLQLSGLKMSDVKVAVNARDGKLAVDPAAALLYQGRYQGRIGLDANAKPVRMDIDSALNGIAIGPLLRDYAKNDKLEGVGTLNLKLTAAGNDSIALKRTLTGTGRLDLKDGVLRGIDARKALENAEIIIEKKSLGAIAGLKQQGGETRFESLTANLVVQNGVVTNDDLLLRSPGLVGTGKGMLANLVTRQIKYDLALGVEKARTTGQDSINVGGYKIPLRCNGSLDDLASACKPDYGDIAKVFAGKVVQDKLQDMIGEKLGLPKAGKAPAPAAAAGPGVPPPPAPAPPPAAKKPEDILKEQLLKGLFGN